MARHRPVTGADVTDERLVVGQLRALQREVHSGFEILTKRLEVMMERFAARQDDHETRIDQLERDRTRTDQRLAALEGARKE
jgi:hypothetical protein